MIDKILQSIKGLLSSVKNLFKGMGDNKCTFPLTKDQIDKMKPCDLVNPMVGKHHGLKLPDDIDFKEAALEIVKVRMEVKAGIYPRWFMEKYWPYTFPMPTHLPKAFELNRLSFEDPAGLADVVHMDNPMMLSLSQHAALTNPRHGGKANVKAWHPKWKQFLETVPDVNYLIAKYQKKFGWMVFEAKSYFGLVRPEEILAPILSEAEFTAYIEGCPEHGETPPGHMTFAQAGTLAQDELIKMDEAELQDNLYGSYLWGMFRCLAGVHFGFSIVMAIILVGGFEKYIRPDILERFTRKK